MAKKTTSNGKTKKKAPSKKAPSKKAVKKRGSGEPGARTSASRKSAGGERKTSRHVEALLEMEIPAREAFLERKTPAELTEIFETSYSGDLVNVLLDLKKNAVRRLFETVSSVRKRSLPELVTLYYYKEYLTNPLPLNVDTSSGEMPNYYAILGVPREASEDDVKHAGKLLLKAHAQECFSAPLRPVARERADEIADAIKHLNTPQRRQATDKLLPSMNYLYPRREQSWLESAERILD